jgi:hypothetical protein
MKSRTCFALAAVVATSTLFCPLAAHAGSLTKTSASNVPSAMVAAKREAARMAPASAVLTQQIDARKMHSGQQFRARLTQTVHLKNGAVLPKGTDLIGTIAKDAMNPDGTSRLILRFTQADMKNGKTVPIVATIMGVSQPSSWELGDNTASPETWNGTTLNIDEIHAVSDFDLHSMIAGPNSGVFVSKKKDEVKLADRTQLSLAIAARNAHGQKGGA